MFRRLLPLAIGLALMLGMTVAFAAQPQTAAANAAVQYIKTLQNADGGFPAFGAESSPGSTIDAVFAMIAQGTNPTTVVTGGNSPDDYLAAQAASYSSDPGAAAKLAFGVASMGLDAFNFGGVELFTILDEGYDYATGSYGLDVFDEAFFVFALLTTGLGTGQPAVTGATQHLRSVQQEDGGWEFAPGSGSDSNTTAMALQALLASGDGPGNPAVLEGVAYLRTTQNADGGFGFVPGADSDPNSTALVIQALVAAGQDIGEGGPWAPEGNTPLEGLLAFRNAETGAFQYADEDSPFATYQAVPALMLAPFPDLQTRAIEGPTPRAPTALEVSPTPSPTATASVGELPPAGGGGRADQTPWWALAALLVGGAGIAGAGALRWRSR